MESEAVISQGIYPSKKWLKKRDFYHVILMGSHYSVKYVNCDLVKVSKFLHVLSDKAFLSNSMTKSHFKSCTKGLVKKKVLRRMIKHYGAMAVLMETNPESSFMNRLLLVRYVAGQFPDTIILQILHDGETVFKRSLIHQIRGFKLNSRPKFYHHNNYNSSREVETPSFSEATFLVSSGIISRNDESSLEYENEHVEEVPLESISVIRRELPESSINDLALLRSHASLRRSKARSWSLIEAAAPSFSETATQSFVSSEDVSENEENSSKDENGYMDKVSLKSISVIRRELPESSTFGWPLLRRTTLTRAALRRSKARSMPLIEWVLGLPRQYSETITNNQIDSDSDESKVFFNSKTRDCNESVDDTEEEKCSRIQESPSGSVSALAEELTQLTPGWPLLRIRTSETVDSLVESEASDMTHTTSAVSLPSESTDDTPKSLIDLSSTEVENSTEKDFCHWKPPGEQRKKAKLVRKLKSSGCKQFIYEELERATHNFSSENLIGEGGCSNVYKGSIRWGKLVAIKVLKQYKEAWSDFSLEVDILSSLKHKHITHLIGVCIEDNHLILVYNFLSKGSLEESLQGHNEKSTLPWKMRFKVAIAVAEALHYLHDECPRQVIHRDVKSSNILLSKDFQPQLSDFGLATWGPKDSAYKTSSDVVGTFGYIAPEYFMHGRVSDKTDMYSFGIVLLELLTGKKPISSKGLKGHESLVKWAMPLIESENLEALLDEKLGGEVDFAQMHRMVLAATLCIKQSPRLRPKASQILKLLKEKKETEEWMDTYANDMKESITEEVDDCYPPEFGHKPSLVLEIDATSLIKTETVSVSTVKQKHRLKLKEYLKEQQD